MPYVRDAIESLHRQTYREFEVIVQDAVSSDGTAEFLAKQSFERIDIVSEPDGGIGDAYNRAFSRCSGAIVTTLDADNMLEPGALTRAVGRFRERPSAAALYGAVQMIAADGEQLDTWVPQPFDRDALIRCELVPPFSTSYFSRARSGAELRFDSSLRTCADFDLWLRLSDREVASTDEVLGRTRLSAKSMSRDASRYEQFCRDKIAALERYLETHAGYRGLRDQAIAGVYCWAAESLLGIEGPTDRFHEMLERARSVAPDYGRVATLVDDVWDRAGLSSPSRSHTSAQ
jgi:glycosyltransferase involved in cell wall biosynthesis